VLNSLGHLDTIFHAKSVHEYETLGRPPPVLKAFRVFLYLLNHLGYVASFGGTEIVTGFGMPPLRVDCYIFVKIDAYLQEVEGHNPRKCHTTCSR
jgi:hypothetical protein